MTPIRKAVTAMAIATLATLAACAGMTTSVRRIDVRLSGAQEVPPLSVAGTGSGSFTIAEDGSVSGSVTTTGVQGTMAHIHQGAKGTNGPVIIPLSKNGDTYMVPPGAKLNEEQMAALRAGNLYVNVHTARNKGGEVRSQLEAGDQVEVKQRADPGGY